MLIHKTKLVELVTVVLLIQGVVIKSDNDSDSDRQKRTIGVLFRTFVDAFQTQRQPAPMVQSFQPLRQTKTTTPQSTKADILASSKNLFQQKKNLFSPASTQTPDTEMVTPNVNPPSSAAPTDQALPQVHHPQNQGPPQALENPFGSFPPTGQQLSPFKAQIFIIPFQGQQGPVPFSELAPGLSAAGTPHLNYQAEFYPHPLQHGVPPPVNLLRYSHTNGWHDVDEILSRARASVSKENVGEQPPSQPQAPELTTYNTNIEPPQTSVTYPETSTYSSPPAGHENEVDGTRQDGPNQHIFYNNNGPLADQSVFVPQFENNGFVNPELFLNNHRHGFPQVPVTSQGFDYPLGEVHTNPNEKNKKNIRTFTVPNSEGGDDQFVHDYMPQRGDSKRSNHQQHHENDYKANQIHYAEHEQKRQQDNVQHTTKIGKVPHGLQQPNNPFVNSGLPQQAAPLYFDQNGPFYDNHYFKRSNNKEKYATKNCNDCNVK